MKTWGNKKTRLGNFGYKTGKLWLQEWETLVTRMGNLVVRVGNFGYKTGKLWLQE